MPYQFRQTGAEIQDILDQVGENTGDIAQNAEDIASLNSNLTNISADLATINLPLLSGVRANTGNATTFTFSGLHNLDNSSIYKYGLFYACPSNTQVILAFVFVNTEGTTTIIPVTNTTGRSFSASVSGTTLTITVTGANLWAGMRLLWLN